MSATSETKKKRRFITAWLIMLLAGLLSVGLFSVYAYRHVSTVGTVLPYDSRSMTYHTADNTPLVTAEPFASGLCVGENDRSLEGLDLAGNALGALYDVSNRKLLFARGMHDVQELGHWQGRNRGSDCADVALVRIDGLA